MMIIRQVNGVSCGIFWFWNCCSVQGSGSQSCAVCLLEPFCLESPSFVCWSTGKVEKTVDELCASAICWGSAGRVLTAATSGRRYFP